MSAPEPKPRRLAASRLDRGAIGQAAADWLALSDGRELTDAEGAEFEAWLASDPRHAAAVAEIAAAWKIFDRLEHYPRPAGEPAKPDFFARPRRFRRVLAMGLAAAAAIAAAGLLWRHPPAPVEHASTPSAAPRAGATRDLRLPDSSKVKLKAGSEIVEEYTQSERHVRLVRGEAQFVVTKNPDRPFVVQAGPVAVRAVGTAFDVRIRSDEIVVLVTEGKVRLDRSEAIDRAPSRLGGVSTAPAFLLLAAKQRAVIPISPQGALLPPVVRTLESREIENALAWESGRFVFDATPLADVVAQFNRCNPQRLKLIDRRLGALRISGTFRMNDVESFVQLLELGFGVGSERQADGGIVLRRVLGDGPEDSRRK